MKTLPILVAAVLALMLFALPAHALLSTYVPNASFEWPANNPDWTYSAIAGWDSNSYSVGVCGSGQADNGNRPDKTQVAFIATDGTGTGGYVQIRSASLTFDTNQEYRLQLWLNARENLSAYSTNFCIYALYVGQNFLGTYTNSAVGVGNPYYFRSFVFKPLFPTARVVIRNYRLDDSAPGTGTLSCLLVDAVCLYQRSRPNEINVQNPSFEASGEQGPGGGGMGLINVSPAWAPLNDVMAGWTYYDGGYNSATFGTGTNSNPYIAPASVPEGQSAFFDNKSERWYVNAGYQTKLKQTIEGLTPSEVYNLSYYYNARPGMNNIYSPSNFTVSIGGVEVQRQDFLPWSMPFYFTTVTFAADWTSMDLVFGTSNSVDGSSMLLDDVEIWPVPEPVLLLPLLLLCSLKLKG